jgi:thiopurine S-methyltransferase
MEAIFWHKRWADNNIAFHEIGGNPLMLKHFSALSLAKGARVFVPLCGKTHDIHWLLANGYRVAGAELSQVAIEQLFAELDVSPKISQIGQLSHYSAHNIDIFVGDIFNLSREVLGPVDAIYDRAALVALPENIRPRYTAHLTGITGNAPQLLICFTYDQSQLDGPPFSISDKEVRQHYGKIYDLAFLESKEVAGGLRGQCAAEERVWVLKGK